MTTFKAKIDVKKKVGEETAEANGAIVIALDSARNLRGITFITESGIAVFPLEPGSYTIISMINYDLDGNPIQAYVISRIDIVDRDIAITVTLSRPGGMGDIKAIVKVDGQRRSGDKLTLEPGGVVTFTDNEGAGRFGNIQGGPYSVRADVVRICSDTVTKGAHQTQSNITAPVTGTLELPEFVLQLCP